MKRTASRRHTSPSLFRCTIQSSKRAAGPRDVERVRLLAAVFVAQLGAQMNGVEVARADDGHRRTQHDVVEFRDVLRVRREPIRGVVRQVVHAMVRNAHDERPARFVTQPHLRDVAVRRHMGLPSDALNELPLTNS